MNVFREKDVIHINKNFLTKTNYKHPTLYTSRFNKKYEKKVFKPNKLYFKKIIINNIKKYNLNQTQINIFKINNLIYNHKSHYTSIFKDNFLFSNRIELLKRYYTFGEISKRFPRFYLYYINYFKFFLKPMFSDFYFSEILRKNGDKQAKYFYEKFNEKNDKNKKKINKEEFKTFFNKVLKREIDNNISNSKIISNIPNININSNNNINIKQRNNYQSTLILSFDSLDNSKNKNYIQSEDQSISLLSLANLINQNNNSNIKKEENNEDDFIKNKINLFLSLNDKTIAQKTTTIVTSARSKIFDTLKEKSIVKRQKNIFKLKGSSTNIRIINDNKSKQVRKYLENNFKENECYINMKTKNHSLKNTKSSLVCVKPKENKIIQKEINNNENSIDKNKKEKEIIIIPFRNNIKDNNYISTNINFRQKANISNLRYTKSNTNLNIFKNFNSKKAPFHITKAENHPPTQITNSNNNSQKFYNSVSNLKKNINNTIEKLNHNNLSDRNNISKNPNYKDYYNSSTQITKIKKKVSASRNIKTEFNQSQKMELHGKSIYFFSSGLNQINRNEKIHKNSHICLESHIFYKTFKKDDNYKTFKGINNLKKESENSSASNRRIFPNRNRIISSSIDDKKQRLNKLFKELENLTILKKNNNDFENNKLSVVEYNKK